MSLAELMTAANIGLYIFARNLCAHRVGMKLTATAFRTQLFSALESAAKGDPVFITHKGRMFRVKEETKKTRLERIDEITPLPGSVFDGTGRDPHDSP